MIFPSRTIFCRPVCWVRRGIVAAIGLGLVLGTVAVAYEHGPGPEFGPRHGPPPHGHPGRGGDHHLARRALEQGRVLPLRVVLEKVEREHQGQVLKIEFEEEQGQFFYEIRLLQSDGRMAKLKVDAVDGRVVFIKRREP